MNLMIFIAVATIGTGIVVGGRDTPVSITRDRLSATITRHQLTDDSGTRICYEDSSLVPAVWECWNE